MTTHQGDYLKLLHDQDFQGALDLLMSLDIWDEVAIDKVAEYYRLGDTPQNDLTGKASDLICLMKGHSAHPNMLTNKLIINLKT